jgi:hypothetical protein
LSKTTSFLVIQTAQHKTDAAVNNNELCLLRHIHKIVQVYYKTYTHIKRRRTEEGSPLIYTTNLLEWYPLGLYWTTDKSKAYYITLRIAHVSPYRSHKRPKATSLSGRLEPPVENQRSWNFNALTDVHFTVNRHHYRTSDVLY